MAGWSSLAKIKPNSHVLQSAARLFGRNTTVSLKNAIVQQIRMGGDHHRTMPITPSRFQWHKFKDMLHFYVMLGAIPLTALIFYCNVFIGPAQLAEIPEGYVPKHWEYNRHPITRFFARYLTHNPQQEYEKMCHYVHEEGEKMQLRKLEKEIKQKMAERSDYQAYYYKPPIVKYHRVIEKETEAANERPGWQ